jgi:repressor LexA
MQLSSPLTDTQAEIVHYFHGHEQAHGRAPTYREIEAGTDLNSTGAVGYQVRALIGKGYLLRDRGVARGIRLTEKARGYLADAGEAARSVIDAVRVPLLGEIRAGMPAIMGHGGVAACEVDDFITIGAAAVGRSRDELFALRVRGESMIDALVTDGDIVVLQRANAVRNGMMAAVRLIDEDEVTLKYFHRHGDRVRLVPANPTFEPIETHAGNVEVQGEVVLVQRQLP